MKNLKKILSLVLALAMALSLMTAAFAADASDYKDYSKVTYNEAVDVMTAAGIFQGNNDNFDPAGTLTREQAAKIIAYMLVGQEKADKLTATIAPYSDVAADRWSAGAIAYCKNEGIIAGTGNGKFSPTAELTGLQFAKMLLVALGYDATIEKLTGDAWAINTSKLALGDPDLDDGMENVSLSQVITREQAAQMAFNTMKATLVEYEDKGDNIIVGGITINTSASKATPVTSKVKADATSISDDKTTDGLYTVEFAEKYCKDLKLKGDYNDLKQPTDKWTYKNNEIGTYATDADKVAVVKDNDKNLWEVLTGSSYMDYGTSDFSYKDSDGDPVNAVAYVNANEVKKTAFESTALQKGDVVYAYENSNGVVTRIVVARYQLAKIDDVSTKMSTTEKDNGAAYRLKLVTLNDTTVGTYYDSYDGDKNELPGFVADTYKEDAVLAVAVNGKKIVDSYVAEVVNGKLSTAREATITDAHITTKGYVKIDGTQYNFAGQLEAAEGRTDKFSFTDEYNVYTTKEGYVIGIDGATATDMSDLYYVTEIFTKDGDYGSTTYYAQRVSMDGKVDTVKLETGAVQALFGQKKVTLNNNTYDTTKAGIYTFNDDKHASTNDYAEQKSNNGKLTIEALAQGNDAYKDFNASTATGLSDDVKVDAKTITLDQKYYVNSETKYISVEKFGDDIDVTTATGGMKSEKGTQGIAIYDPDDSKTALAVVYFGNKLNTSVSSQAVVYVADKPTAKVSADNWEATLYFMDDNTTKDVVVDDNYDVGFYTFSEKDGVYKLEDATLLGNSKALVYDDEKGAVEKATITAVYNKNGVSTITATAKTGENAVTLTDVSTKNLLVFDNRGDDKDGDVYDTEITSISDLKDAVKDSKTVTADIYLNDGVTFICITEATAK